MQHAKKCNGIGGILILCNQIAGTCKNCSLMNKREKVIPTMEGLLGQIENQKSKTKSLKRKLKV